MPILRFSIGRDYNNKPHFLANFVYENEGQICAYSQYYSYNEGITQDCIFSALTLESWVYSEEFCTPNFGYELNYESLRAGGTMEGMKSRIKFLEKIEKELQKLDDNQTCENLADYIIRLNSIFNFRIEDEFRKVYTLSQFQKELMRYENK